MESTLRFIAGAFLVAALYLFGDVAPASAQDGTTTIYARAGQPVIVGQPAVCVRLTTPAPDSDLGKRFQIVGGTAGSTAVEYLLFTPLEGDTAVEAKVETGPKANGAACDPATLATYRILTDRTPEIPQDSLNKSFTILLTAFVLALLLESAFALLFNWRLFLEFFVGKAWRTPIMFAGALIVVRYFDLDLMAKLFAAYNPPATGSGAPGNWFTSIITAMILAGGSIGVNRILVGLGFRSQAGRMSRHRSSTRTKPGFRSSCAVTSQLSSCRPESRQSTRRSTSKTLPCRKTRLPQQSDSFARDPRGGYSATFFFPTETGCHKAAASGF